MKPLAWLVGTLVLLTFSAQAAVIASGKADGKMPAWTIESTPPPGWTVDCCRYARAIGVDAVIYQGEWSGEPDRVIVLNVWPRKLASLDEEWQDDRKHYLERDPAGKAQAFTVQAKAPMTCKGGLYQGGDHIEDVVVFCDPNQASGIRFSWSMTLAAGAKDRQQVLDQFRHVVEQTTYAKHVALSDKTAQVKP